ncbi:MAG: flippase-like domain-containing protein [Bacteroidetes bacterium]|nr:flippase-like domain-containing protein [Bacteroidota bacterium]
MKKNLFSVINFSVFFLIGFFLLWLVFRKIDIGNVVQQILKANYWWILLSFVFAVISHMARAIRWNILINSMGYKTKTITTFYAVMVGYFANLALPRLGEVSRCGVLGKKNDIPFDSLFGSVVSERMVDLAVLILLIFSVIIFQMEIVGGFVNKVLFDPILSKFSTNLFGILTVLLCLTVIIVVLVILYKIFKARILELSIFKKAHEFIRGFLNGVKTIKSIKRKGEFLLLTFIIWFMYFLMTYVVFSSLTETAHLTILDGITVLAIGSLGMAAPVPGGLGAYHFIIKAILFEVYKIPAESATSWATLIHTTQNLMIIVVGAFSYFMLVGTKK